MKDLQYENFGVQNATKNLVCERYMTKIAI